MKRVPASIDCASLQAAPGVFGNRDAIPARSGKRWGVAGIVCSMLSPQVVELEVLEPYKIRLRFDDDVAGVVDLSDSAALGGVFAAWSERDFWRSAHIVETSGAVAWGDGTQVDACPLSLYLDVTGQTFDEFSSTSPVAAE